MAIVEGGIEVFPRLVAAEHRRATTRARLASEIPELDALLGGGLGEASSTLIVGASGTGKSTLAAKGFDYFLSGLEWVEPGALYFDFTRIVPSHSLPGGSLRCSPQSLM